MVWLDILVIGIIILFALIGFIKGFMRGFLSLFSTLVTLVLAIVIAKPLSNLFENWFGLSSAIAGSLEPSFLNFFQTNSYDSGWISQLLNIVMGSDYMATSPAVEVLAHDFSVKIGILISVAICVVILYILIRIVLWLLSKLVKKIIENRGVSGLDRIFGVVIGLGKAAVYIFVAMGIVFVLGSFITPLGAWVDNMMGNNPVAGTIYGWVKGFMQNTLLPFIFK